jgi:hypothetical protein
MEVFSEMVPLIILDTPGALEFAVLQSIRKSARKFCRESEAWRGVNIQNTVGGQSEYVIPIDYDALIWRVIEIKLAGRTLNPSEYELDGANSKIILSSAASSGKENGFYAKYSLLPEFNSNEMTYPFIDKWAEAVICGAKADLLKQPKKTYTDYELSSFHEYEFNKYINMAKTENLKDGKSVDLGVDLSAGRVW